MQENKIKISYCTTCCNRLWQLVQTLPDNLKNLKNDEEIILVDYGSKDNLDLYIGSNEFFYEFLKNGKLTFVQVLDVDKYNCPKAKNIAHRLAKGKFLVNLDADNSNFQIRKKILSNEKSNNSILHFKCSYENEGCKGTYGKICVPRKIFYMLGGHDEYFLPTAYQDTDLLERAKATGIEVIEDPILIDSIQNTMNEKVKETGFNDWWKCLEVNRKISLENLSKKKYIANIEKGWGYARAIINFYDLKEYKPIFPKI